MKSSSGPWMLLIYVGIIYLLIDLYVYRGIRILMTDLDQPAKQVIKYLYWGASFALLILIIYNAFIARDAFSTGQKLAFFNYSFAALLLFLLPKLVYAIVLAIDDIVHLSRLATNSFIKPVSDSGISRLTFINQIGLLFASIPMGAIIYGVLKGRFDFNVKKEMLSFDHLPSSFDGIKVVQISDMHLGSFYNNYAPVEKAIEKINDLQPDLLLFTGDMVNNFAQETEGWAPVLSKLKAKYGKYSILGNHDYGDYRQWERAEDKLANFEAICKFHKTIGFKLMMDENESIQINDDKIRLIGVQNWGMKGGLRKQYGDLQKALEGSYDKEFKILMSHDPSHWEGQVLTETNIDLTLSGHTHGMQFGIRIPGFQWSAVKYIYKQWAGLYSKGNRHIYVNAGFGYIGFPGRVGISPEITEITLKSTLLSHT